MRSVVNKVRGALVVLLIVAATSVASGETDPVGRSLRNSMIWDAAPADDTCKPASVVFRKQVNISELPKRALVHIFADSRYVLWMNGEYVLRGPSRFHPKRPEYDTIDVARFLKRGPNTLAVLVQGGLSGHRFLKHAPGLAVRLEVEDLGGGVTNVDTGPTWRSSRDTRFLPPRNLANCCVANDIDAAREKGHPDWTLSEFDDSAWQSTVKVDGSPWGPFHPRAIPLLRETEVHPLAVMRVSQSGKTDNSRRPLADVAPIEIRAPAEIVIDAGQMVLAYYVLDFEADEGSRMSFAPRQSTRQNAAGVLGNVNYKARAGRQTHMCVETYTFRYLHVKLDSGRMRLHGVKIVNRLYPFDCLGRFRCNDTMLNDLWTMAVHTAKVDSEDACVDGWERGEWITAYIDYPMIRVAFAGRGSNDDRPVYSDARLIGNMLRRNSLNQKNDRILGSTCPSQPHMDPNGIHTVIEDSASYWIQNLRMYYDATGDEKLVSELWPVLADQIKWFLDRRTSRGLVKAREWFLHFDNPVAFQTDCEGTTLNAIIYRGIKDAAYLAGALGKEQQAAEYAAAADALKRDFNRYLWDEASRTYYAGIKEGKRPLPRWNIEITKAYFARVDPSQKEFPPTVQAAMMALDKGLVPPQRLDSTRQYMRAHAGDLVSPFAHLFLFENLYRINSREADAEVLRIIRKRWAPMVAQKDPGTLGEQFVKCDYVCHNFGPIPAPFLAEYVLGVRMDGPVWRKRIVIEPRLGDLSEAEGVVVTRHGPVPVSWKMVGDNQNGGQRLDFRFEVPEGAKATVSIPAISARPTLTLNGKTLIAKGNVQWQVKLDSRFATIELATGKYSGKISP